MFAVLSFTLFCISAYGAPSGPSEVQERFGALINEKGTAFLELIEVSKEKKQVIYHVPQHNNVMAMDSMQDFNFGYEILCLPAAQQCHLINLNRSIYADPEHVEMGMAKLWANAHGMMSSNDTTEILRKFYLSDGPLRNLLFLSKEMQNFVAQRGFPVYRYEKVPEDAEFLEEEKPSDKTKREKRDLDMDLELNNIKCSGGQSGAWKFAYVRQNSCDWLNFCDGPCQKINKVHVRNVMFLTCLCCPYHRRSSECKLCVDQQQTGYTGK